MQPNNSLEPWKYTRTGGPGHGGAIMETSHGRAAQLEAVSGMLSVIVDRFQD